MTRARNLCPICSTEMVASWQPLHHRGVLTSETLFVVEAHSCPNYDNHGIQVQCANGCGKLVDNARYHYHYIPGVYGSGKWSCVPQFRYIDGVPVDWPPKETTWPT